MRAMLRRQPGRGKGGFDLRDLPVPAPRADEIVIRLAGASVNPIDTLIREGYGDSLFKWLRRSGPVVQGLDGAGVVDSIGSAVRDFAVGDRVMAAAMPFASGFYAEAVAVKAAWACRIPDGLGMAEACTLPYAGLTVSQALAAAGLHAGNAAGKRVLVHGGSGGIGSLLVQCLHHWGAWVASTCSGGNAEFVRGLGADQIIDYRKQDYTQVLSGLDAVINTVAPDPSARKLDEAPQLSVLKAGGAYASLISPTLTLADALGAPLGLAASAAWMGGARLRWALAGKRHRWVYFRPSGQRLAELGCWAAEGWCRPVVGRRFALTELAAAHAAVEQGPARGKVFLEIDRTLLQEAA